VGVGTRQTWSHNDVRIDVVYGLFVVSSTSTQKNKIKKIKIKIK